MATCKDCMHCDVCYVINAKIAPADTPCDECPRFKDKSKFVKLPCKVGDTVYEIDGGNSESGDIYSSVVRRVIFDTTGIAFDERAIGKAIFLTREEAEKALKEREQE